MPDCPCVRPCARPGFRIDALAVRCRCPARVDATTLPALAFLPPSGNAEILPPGDTNAGTDGTGRYIGCRLQHGEHGEAVRTPLVTLP